MRGTALAVMLLSLPSVITPSESAGAEEPTEAKPAARRPVSIRLRMSPERLPEGAECEIYRKSRDADGQGTSASVSYEGTIVKATANEVLLKAMTQTARQYSSPPVVSRIPAPKRQFQSVGVGRRDLDGKEIPFAASTIETVYVRLRAGEEIELTPESRPKGDAAEPPPEQPEVVFDSSPAILPAGTRCEIDLGGERGRARRSPPEVREGTILEATNEGVRLETPVLEGRAMQPVPVLADLPVIGRYFVKDLGGRDRRGGETIWVPVKEINTIRVRSLPQPADGESR